AEPDRGGPLSLLAGALGVARRGTRRGAHSRRRRRAGPARGSPGCRSALLGCVALAGGRCLVARGLSLSLGLLRHLCIHPWYLLIGFTLRPTPEGPGGKRAFCVHRHTGAMPVREDAAEGLAPRSRR